MGEAQIAAEIRESLPLAGSLINFSPVNGQLIGSLCHCSSADGLDGRTRRRRRSCDTSRMSQPGADEPPRPFICERVVLGDHRARDEGGEIAGPGF